MDGQNRSKVMLVTMGTSLFYSASWNFDLKFFDNNEYYYNEYKKWLQEEDLENDPGPLISPEKRLLVTSPAFKKYFEAKLKNSLSEIDKWIGAFVYKIMLSQILRYSAELSTIFELGLSNGEISKYLNQFKIYLITDDIGNPLEPNKQYIAAFHIKRYLEKIIGENSIEFLTIPQISSPKPNEMIGQDDTSGLNLLFRKMKNIISMNDEVYIIASGGYKGYGILFGPLIKVGNIKIVYRHEEGQNLIIVDQEKIYFPKLDLEIENQFFTEPEIGIGD